ncbi:MAG TPA: VOC family protein [Candidatus Nitrosocosmicus sp.]|nr:VOC family protein [Candidatus Nitrosocosmicus sp.]
MKYSFVTVTVKDMEESAKFYKDVLGMKEVRRFTPQPGVDIMFLKDEGGSAIELISHEGNEDFIGRIPVSIGFDVDSLEDTGAMLKERGVVISRGPLGAPGGVRFLFVKDPNGVEIEFIEGFQL